MSNKVIVHKGRTNTLIINMGIDISERIITSEIRSEPTVESPLLATWTVTFVTNGTDGKLKLMLDDLATSQIDASSGYMDLKRVVAGEAISVFDTPLEVSFRGTVTA
jgi:hypothetical protein